MHRFPYSKLGRQYHHKPPSQNVINAAPRYVPFAKRWGPILQVAPPAPVILPSIDPRPLCRPVRDQGAEGSCTGHGTTAVRELAHAYTTGKALDDWLSPAFVYACSRMAEGSFPADNGSSVADSMAVLYAYGACQELMLPYDADPAEAPTPACYVGARPFRVSEQPCMVDMTNDAIVREVLCCQRAIAIGITVYEGALEETGPDGKVPVSDATKPILGGHEVALLGYLEDGSYLVRNSWSSGWGLGGYCLFDPKDLAAICTEAWCVAPQA